MERSKIQSKTTQPTNNKENLNSHRKRQSIPMLKQDRLELIERDFKGAIIKILQK